MSKMTLSSAPDTLRGRLSWLNSGITGFEQGNMYPKHTGIRFKIPLLKSANPTEGQGLSTVLTLFSPHIKMSWVFYLTFFWLCSMAAIRR